MFLVLERPVVTMYKLLYLLKLSILSTHFVYTCHMIFTTNSYHFPIQSLYVFFIMDIQCVLCEVGTNFLCGFRERQSKRGGIILSCSYFIPIGGHILLFFPYSTLRLRVMNIRLFIYL